MARAGQVPALKISRFATTCGTRSSEQQFFSGLLSACKHGICSVRNAPETQEKRFPDSYGCLLMQEILRTDREQIIEFFKTFWREIAVLLDDIATIPIELPFPNLVIREQQQMAVRA